jgi:hypothetical protein
MLSYPAARVKTLGLSGILRNQLGPQATRRFGSWGRKALGPHWHSMLTQLIPKKAADPAGEVRAPRR